MNPKASKKREMILDAAMKSILEHGYRKTTLEDIAGELGLTKTALYYYFKSKDDLVLALADRQLITLLEDQKKILELDKDIMDRLCDIIDYKADFTDKVTSSYKNIFEEIFEIVPFLRNRIIEHTSQSINMIIQYMEKAWEGKKPPVNIPAFSAFFEFSHQVFGMKLYAKLSNEGLACSTEEFVIEIKNIIRKALTQND
ncbi:TetR/AcrR family transcriptional regulator [Myxococcota bacterium]|nr:TetR/AcrR family transcriptional regulator [Myxococcota bacterium]MBU1379523.1 TetR/AcrR family transcriptional regulator [Myxococcota bacterium]MBU1498957.1 TetR/AcrR family transcriptional regulator [Myxococcota bacterium]